uniref:Putative salivary lipocalin n=1 Tax=Ixodes ricinus TaxID=34613 RepID=A0A147BW01_IXORI
MQRTCLLVITTWFIGVTKIKCDRHIPAEDDPLYSEFQHPEKLFSGTETYFMKYRTYLNESKVKCISSTLQCTYGNGTYLSQFGARLPNGETIAFNLPVTLTTTPGHNASNAMLHKTSPADKNDTLFILMYLEPNRTCSVLRVPSQQNGCSLFVQERIADREVPAVCAEIYRNNCPNITNILYEPSCQTKHKNRRDRNDHSASRTSTLL